MRHNERVAAFLLAATLLVTRTARGRDEDVRQPRLSPLLLPRLVSPPGAMSPPAASEPPPPPLTGPRVLFEADSPTARLFQLNPRGHWQEVCRAPCTALLAATGTYRVGGGDVRPSPVFALPRGEGEMTISAEVGSKAKHYVGLGLMIGGAVAMAYGGLYYSFFHDVRGLEQRAGSSPSESTRFYENAGLLALGAGLVAVAVGIPLWFSNTTVQIR